MEKPLYAKIIVDTSSGIIFRTDNGELEVELVPDDKGKVSVKYEFRARIPRLKEEQRN